MIDKNKVIDEDLHKKELKEALENFINVFHKYGCDNCPFHETCIELVERNARFKGSDYDEPYDYIFASWSSICLIARKMLKQLEGDTYRTCVECKHCGSKQVYGSNHIRWNCMGYHIYPVERFTQICKLFKPDSEYQHKYPTPEPEPEYEPLPDVTAGTFEALEKFRIKTDILEGMLLLDKGVKM